MSFTGTFHAPLVDDQLDYLRLAQNLATGAGFVDNFGPTVNRFPFYPIFLAVIEWLFGSSPEVIRVAQAGLAALGVPLIWFIGTSAGPRGAGCIAALLYAVNPFVMRPTRFIHTESLLSFLLLIMGTVCMMCLRSREHTGRWVAVLGVVLGLCVLTRGQILLCAVLVTPWLCVVLRDRLRPIRTAALMWTALMLVLAPWVVRNWIEFERFIPLTAGYGSSSGGYVFWSSNNALAATPGDLWGAWVHHDILPEAAEYEALPRTDPTFLEGKAYEYGFRFLSSRPDLIPSLLLGKTVRFWRYHEPLEDGQQGSQALLLTMTLTLLPFGALGLSYQLHNLRRCFPFLAIVGAVFISTLIYWGDTRFRAPIEPYITLTVAIGMASLAAVIHATRLLWRQNRGALQD
ncbi:MAG TPA: glycosyltransferase family 39 protein [Chloroflexia bacterium]|nr:glycosyltransferase family 39 protein [Chloroflexia bacterium]